VDVEGVPGQRVVLSTSPDLRAWRPLATNWLTSNRWTYIDSQTSVSQRFYRAKLR
jgi:hypothetical protein